MIIWIAATAFCGWLVVSGLRDMLGSGRRTERPNVTTINVRIENSFNGGTTNDRNETETEAARTSFSTSGSTKRW